MRQFPIGLVVLLGLLAAPPAAGQNGANDRVVRGLSFQGNRAIDDYTLRISIVTSESSAWQRWGLLRWAGLGEKRYFDETEFRRDVLRIGLLYRQSGFFEVQVDTVVRRGEADVGIAFHITEGEPVRVISMAVAGAGSVLPDRDLLRELPLQVGDPFNRFRLKASADTIRAVLANRGYPFVDVFQSFDEDRAAREARVSFTVDPGPLTRIGRVGVVGTEQIDSGVVRRAASVQRGQLFRRDALYESQLDLYRTGLFDFVTVDLADSVVPRDSLAAVRIQVAEGRLHRLRSGGGFGALDCFRGLAGVTALNFMGAGRRLDLTGQVSKLLTQSVCPRLGGETDTSRLKLNYNVALSLREPFLLSRHTSAALSLFAERRSELNTYVRTAQGGQLALTEDVARDVPLTLSYSLVFGRTVADQAVFCSLLNLCRQEDSIFNARRRESTLGLTLVRDRSNSPLDPSRGSVFSAQGRYASPRIGSDSLSHFTKGVLELASYHRVGRRGVFAWRVRAGAILPAELNFIQRGQFAPPAERLYAGGPTTVRGYGQNEMWPLVRVLESVRTDPETGSVDSLIRVSPVGGNRLVVANAEYRFILAGLGGRLSGAAFVDLGRVWTTEGRAAAGRAVRVTPGIGLRLVTPLGPIRLDVAYNPYDPTPGPLYRPVGGDLVLERSDYAPAPPTTFAQHLKVHFSVGQAF